MKRRILLLPLLLMMLLFSVVFTRDVHAADEDWAITYVGSEYGIQTMICDYKGNASSVTIPTSVNHFPVDGVLSYTFMGNTSLKTIIVPDGMYVEGFGGCNVRKIQFKGKAKIGYDGFSGCKYLNDITLPSNVTEIDDSMFKNCVNLKTLKLSENIKRIGENAFYGCKKLEKLKIPKSVTEIGYGAFAYCSKLTGLTVDKNNPNYYHGSSGVLYARNGKDIEIIFAGAVSGDYVVSKKVDEIRHLAFVGAKELKSVTIPANVGSVVIDTFKDCPKLKKITFEGKCSPYGTYISYPNITFYVPTKSGTYYDEVIERYKTVVYGEPTVKTQPKDVRAAVGEKATFSVKTDVTKATYQWEVSKDGGKTWVKTGESGNKTKQLKVATTVTKYGRLYRCVITDKYSGKSSVSKAATLLEDKIYATILKEPTNGYARLNETVKTKITAEGDGLTYQWYVKEAGASKYVKSSVKKNTYSYKMTPEKDGRRAYCVITDMYGNSVRSKTVLFRAAATILEELPVASAPIGEAAEVKVNAYGKDLTYQWVVKMAGIGAFTGTKVKTDTYSLKMSEENDGTYVYCIVKDKYGNKATTYSTRLWVAATITTQPKNVAVESGSTAKTKVVAYGKDLKYTWYVKDVGSEEFVKSSTVKDTYSCKMSATKDGRQVYCIITDSLGNSVQSETVTLSLK